MTKKEKQAQKMIIEEIEKAQGVINDFCVKYCKDNQTQAVPLLILQNAHYIFINGMKEGSGIK